MGDRTRKSELDVQIVPDDDYRQQRRADYREEGVEVPLDRIRPEILYNMIAEFVTREWEELGDSPYTLEEKIEQVQVQVQQNKAKVVFDLSTNSCNIVVNQ
ncbi:hypothetical protein OR1_01724 [Geobacter sp. OR-1]|uniref:YheU family protein n=1 Tax=Geobacter sp. OR-1 TaxID=1266765 RepID=UPI000543AF36|nr:YheU family protein [Geobacter sp. OR-1]GAM09445.1 hypothetical protein OR1_01724 [Geobacter sp. OR-1]